MAQCMEYIKSLFPAIDEEMYQYIKGKLFSNKYLMMMIFSHKHPFVILVGVLENGIEDFQGEEEIYEAIGEVLLQLDESKTECDIKYVIVYRYKLINSCIVNEV